MGWTIGRWQSSMGRRTMALREIVDIEMPRHETLDLTGMAARLSELDQARQRLDDEVQFADCPVCRAPPQPVNGMSKNMDLRAEPLMYQGQSVGRQIMGPAEITWEFVCKCGWRLEYRGHDGGDIAMLVRSERVYSREKPG